MEENGKREREKREEAENRLEMAGTRKECN
jgi:hypothetical protein